MRMEGGGEWGHYFYLHAIEFACAKWNGLCTHVQKNGVGGESVLYVLVCVLDRVAFVCVCVSAYLRLFYSHLAFLALAMETLRDPPHSFARAYPLHKVGREETHLLFAFPLCKHTHIPRAHTHTSQRHTHTHSHTIQAHTHIPENCKPYKNLFGNSTYRQRHWIDVCARKVNFLHSCFPSSVYSLMSMIKTR